MTRVHRFTPAWLLAVLAVASLLVASAALSFVPKGSRIAKATAASNRAAARTQALKLAVSFRVADREPIAKGSLITHPNGLARLELQSGADLVERHLLVGTEHTASRGGAELETPRTFLPPLFLLQAESELALEQALSDYGMDIEAVALAPCGSRVCYVIGDPARVAPPPPREAGSDEEAPDAAGDNAADAPVEPRETEEAALAASPVATIWIDTESFQITRMESRDGVAIELGAFVTWGDVLFPESITILEPEQEPVHFDVLSVTPVNAPAAEFGRAWLLAPVSQFPTAVPPDAP